MSRAPIDGSPRTPVTVPKTGRDRFNQNGVILLVQNDVVLLSQNLPSAEADADDRSSGSCANDMSFAT